jgi:hypothetical protein
MTAPSLHVLLGALDDLENGPAPGCWDAAAAVLAVFTDEERALAAVELEGWLEGHRAAKALDEAGATTQRLREQLAAARVTAAKDNRCVSAAVCASMCSAAQHWDDHLKEVAR